MPYNKTPTERRINNKTVYFLDALKVSKSKYNEYILKKALYIEPKTKEEIEEQKKRLAEKLVKLRQEKAEKEDGLEERRR